MNRDEKIAFLMECFRNEQKLEVQAAYSEFILRLLTLYDWTAQISKRIDCDEFRAIHKTLE